jgi:hypothetical protein
MPVYVTLPLFGLPGQELGEDAAPGGRQLRALGDELRERLHRAAEAVDRLTAAGWSARTGASDVLFQYAAVRDPEEAGRRLRELGLDPEQFLIFEEDEDG